MSFDWDHISPYIVNSGPMSVLTFFLGFFSSRFTLSKKEKADIDQKKFENASALSEKQNDRYVEFANALKAYLDKKDPPTIDDFFAISTTGDKYFYQQQLAADAVLSNSIDRRSRDDTFLPKFRESIDKSIPAYYSNLKTIARKVGLEYEGSFKRRNYESIFLATEKYGK